MPGATAGGIITAAAVETGFRSLDPSDAYWTDLNSILSGLVVRSLTQLVYDPDTHTLVLVPDLATDVGTPNDDFTQWTFTIRPGVRFEDGTPVTAQDVAYGIERSFDRKTFPDGASFSNDYFLDGDTYRGPYGSGTDYPGIVVDGDTLTLKMARPFVDLPYWASWPAMSPIPPGPASSPTVYRDHPLATGPYKVAAYTHRGDHTTLRLVRNEEWDPNTDPGRHQYADGFRFTISGAASDSVSRAILSDTPDGQTSLNYLPSTDAVGQAVAAGRGVARGSDQCVYVEALDMRKITDIRVRRAVGYAFPYRSFLRATAGNYPGVTRKPSRSLLPPGTAGAVAYNPLTTPPGATDADQSRALLRAAGYKPGEYRIDFPYDVPFGEAGVSVIVKALEAGGFDAVAHPVPDRLYFDRRGDANAPYNMRPFGWCSDFPDGYRSVLGLFTDKGYPDLTFLNDPSVDSEVIRLAALPLDEQAVAWGKFDQHIENDVYPYVVTAVEVTEALYGSRLGGMHITGDYGMPTWKDLYVRR